MIRKNAWALKAGWILKALHVHHIYPASTLVGKHNSSSTPITTCSGQMKTESAHSMHVATAAVVLMAPDSQKLKAIHVDGYREVTTCDVTTLKWRSPLTTG